MTAAPTRVDMRDSYHQPRLVGLDSAARFVTEERGVPISAHYLKRACESKPPRVSYSLIGGKRCFSEADLDALLVSLRKDATA